MIYRGGRAALALICEQVLVKLPSLCPVRWICGWRGGMLHLFTHLVFQVRDAARNQERQARWAQQKPQAPASLIGAPLFWDQLHQLCLGRAE